MSEIVKLGDVCKFKRGLTYSKKDEVDYSKNIVVRATNINLENNKLNLSELKYIKESINIDENKILKKGDILICTASGSKSHLGKVALIDKDIKMAFGGFMGVLKTSEKCLPKFLYNILISQKFKKLLLSNTDGANINNLRFSQIENFEFILPSLPEQQRIVAKLDEVSEIIDENIVITKNNMTNVEKFFSNYLSNLTAPMSELGEYVTIKTGKLDSNAAVDNGKYPFFTCSKKIFSINVFAFDCEAVLLAGNNASGDFNVKYYKGKFNAYQRTYVITINNTNKLSYKYLYYQLINALQKFKQMSVGANTRFLKIGMIKDFKFPLPNIKKQLMILKKLENIENNKNVLKENYFKKLTLINILKDKIQQKNLALDLDKIL